MDKIKVFLLDDHQIVRDGIKSLLAENSTIEVVGEAEDCYRFFEQIKATQPDILVLDISLPKMSGIDVAKKVKEAYPSIKIIMLSMYTNEDFIFNSLKAGASGYLPKNTTKRELEEAIFEVSVGREYFSKEISEIVLKSYVRKAQVGNDVNNRQDIALSAREIEVLKLVAEGKQNTDIASDLFISTRTVESHRNHIMKKLGLSSTVDLVKYAIRNKIIEL